MKITIEGTDFVVSRTVTENVTAFIAANDRAEKLVWKQKGGNRLRTAFGLTHYAQNEKEYASMIAKIKAEGMTYEHALA